MQAPWTNLINGTATFEYGSRPGGIFNLFYIHLNSFFFFSNLFYLSTLPLRNCGRQEEPAILIFRLLLRMRRMYVASIHLDFH